MSLGRLHGILSSELHDALESLPFGLLDRVVYALPPDYRERLVRSFGSEVDERFQTESITHFLMLHLGLLDSSEQRDLALLVREALAPEVTDLSSLLSGLDSSPNLPAPLARILTILLALEHPEHEDECIELLDGDPRLRVPWIGGSVASRARDWRERVSLLHTVSTHGIDASVDLFDATHHAHPAAQPLARVGAAIDLDDTALLDNGLFTALDVTVIQAAMATAAEVSGALDPTTLPRAIEELLRLNGGRPASYFHLGFASVVLEQRDIPWPAELESKRPPQGDQLRWYRLGRLCGLIRGSEPAALVHECVEHRRTVLELIRQRLMGSLILTGVVRAVMHTHPPIAAEFLQARTHHFPGAMDLYRDIYWRARMLVISERSAEAEPLFRSLRTLPLHIHDDSSERQRQADLTRRISTCKRSLDDFIAAANELSTVNIDDLDDVTAAALLAEWGLVAGRIRHLSHVGFPSSEGDREALRERLTSGTKHFEAALSLNPDDLRACYCLGVLAVCEGAYQRSATMLERAEAALISDPVLSRTRLLNAARFHRALATLQSLEVGTDAAAVDSMVHALEQGYRPSTMAIMEAVDALVAHASTHLGCFLRRVVETTEIVEPLLPTVLQHLEPDLDELRPIVFRIAADARLSFRQRFDVLLGAIASASHRGLTGLQEELLEHIDGLLERACDPELEQHWADLLGTESGLRELLDPAEADLVRASVLQRLGAFEDAKAILLQLFYRAAEGSLDRFDPADLLASLERLVSTEDELEALRRLIRQPTESTQPALRAPLHVLFAGGNETQAQYQEQITAALQERYGPDLTITWFTPGWDMNWIKDADRIVAAMPSAQAIVILTYMRTNLGRHLRKAANEHNLVWRSCTGQGRASMERSLISAINGALELTTPTPTSSQGQKP